MKVKRGDKDGEVLIELKAGETQMPAQESVMKESHAPSFQLKNIMVPVDFSIGSKKALRYAISMASQFNAEIILFHAVQPYVPGTAMDVLMVPSTKTELDENTSEQLKAFQLMIDNTVSSMALTRVGSPHAEIVNMAKELNIDLIVLSTHGYTGLKHMLLGSTAEKVVRHASCPVLVVRERE